MSTQYKLTYFDIEGLAEKVRLAFALGGIEYTDNRIDFAAFGKLKSQTPAGTLPILEITEGGKTETITQSNAMLHLIGCKAGLVPSKPCEELKVNEIIGIEGDAQNSLAPSLLIGMRPERVGHGDTPEDKRKEIVAKLRADLAAEGSNLRNSLKLLNERVKDNHPQKDDEALGAAARHSKFAVGPRPTIADLAVLPLLRRLRSGVLDGIPPTIVDDYPALVELEKALYAIPVIGSRYEKK